MYIERVPNRNSPPAVLLRESWREDGKVKKRTVANLSGLPDELIEALRATLKGESIPASEGIASPEKAISIHDARQHGHVAAIHSVLKKSELLGMIDSKRSRERDVVAAMVIDRIINGDSKLATVRHCNPETAWLIEVAILSHSKNLARGSNLGRLHCFHKPSGRTLEYRYFRFLRFQIQNRTR